MPLTLILLASQPITTRAVPDKAIQSSASIPAVRNSLTHRCRSRHALDSYPRLNHQWTQKRGVWSKPTNR